MVWKDKCQDLNPGSWQNGILVSDKALPAWAESLEDFKRLGAQPISESLILRPVKVQALSRVLSQNWTSCQRLGPIGYLFLPRLLGNAHQKSNVDLQKLGGSDGSS